MHPDEMSFLILSSRTGRHSRLVESGRNTVVERSVSAKNIEVSKAEIVRYRARIVNVVKQSVLLTRG